MEEGCLALRQEPVSRAQDRCRILGGCHLLNECSLAALCSNRAYIQAHSLIFGRCSRCRKSSLLDACLAWRVSLLLVCTPWQQVLQGRWYQAWGASEQNPAFHPQGCCISLLGPDSAAFGGGKA